MKIMKLTVMSVITVFLILAAGSFAFAAMIDPSHAEAGAEIDYTTFNIDFSGTGRALDTYFESGAQGLGFPRETNSLKVELGSELSSFYASAETDVNETGLDYQDMRSFAKVADVTRSGWGLADAGYFGEFSADTAGTLTISFDYYLYASAFADNQKTAEAKAGVFLTINGEQAADSLSFVSAKGKGFDREQDWTLMTFSLDLSEGQTVDFSAIALSDAKISTVPVPASLWILGAGLAGLVGIRRRGFAA